MLRLQLSDDHEQISILFVKLHQQSCECNSCRRRVNGGNGPIQSELMVWNGS